MMVCLEKVEETIYMGICIEQGRESSEPRAESRERLREQDHKRKIGEQRSESRGGIAEQRWDNGEQRAGRSEYKPEIKEQGLGNGEQRAERREHLREQGHGELAAEQRADNRGESTEQR